MRKIKGKIGRIVLVSLLVATFLTGGVFIAFSETTTITVWSRNEQMEQIVSMFNEKMEEENRDVEATFELVPWGQQVQKLMAALVAGKAPDVFSLGIGRLRYFVEQGGFLEITDRAKELPYFEHFPDNMVDIGRKDGKLYALPAVADLSAMLYNKELFREAGLDPNDPPETWEEFIEYGKKLTKDTDGDGQIDQWGYHIADYTGFWYLPFIWSNGGRMATIDNEVKFGSDSVKEWVQLWVDAVNKYKIAPEESIQWRSSDWYNNFVNGKLAMMHGGNWNIETLPKDAPDLDYGVTFIPKPEGGTHYTYAGGNSIAVTRQTDHPELAWEFIEFYMDSDTMYEAFITNNVLPARMDLYDNPYFNNEMPKLKEFKDLLSQSRIPVTSFYSQFKSIAETYLEKAILQKLTVEEAVDQAAAEMKKAVEDAS